MSKRAYYHRIEPITFGLRFWCITHHPWPSSLYPTLIWIDIVFRGWRPQLVVILQHLKFIEPPSVLNQDTQTIWHHLLSLLQCMESNCIYRRNPLICIRRVNFSIFYVLRSMFDIQIEHTLSICSKSNISSFDRFFFKITQHELCLDGVFI